ncbi:hypothetical protein [Virgibacillus oceani]|uniref:Uncharacterized protein n=1 Tax=Virgibacillus oceani TaxID=1479511 RepID=A0A917H289_9BACI|nr:hypothetical protein [Virgibacillus oceani]GGG64512.1 hypothetical protein GCM10011398_05130 [Virgibacillus oceani]
MKLHNHFLKDDISKASEEYWRAMEALSNTMTLMNQGRISEAKHVSIGITKALHEQEKLTDKKRQSVKEKNLSNIESLIEELEAKGVHIRVVRGLHHEQ